MGVNSSETAAIDIGGIGAGQIGAGPGAPAKNEPFSWSGRTIYRAEAEAPLPLWPLTLMVAFYPLWFLLGLSGFMWVLLAGPMAAAVIRRRNLTAPKGIGLWMVFLLAVMVSGLSVDTVSRMAGYVLRVGYYAGATVFLIYLLNGGRSVSVPKIVRVFTLLWIFTVVGGYVALIIGDFSFRSPMWYLMPGPLLNNDLIKTLVTPGFADVHDIIGVPVARPKAPFPYTNSWGSMMALTTPFALMAMTDNRVEIPRRLVKVMLVASVVPIVISLNRGLWLSLGVGVIYTGIRLGVVSGGRLLPKLLASVVVLVALIAFSPLGDVVASRIDNGHSDGDRFELASAAIGGAMERPLFGWGSPRPNVGNQPSIGTHGQIWLVTFSHGFVGAAGFVGAIVAFLFWTRRQVTTAGLWAHSVLVIALAQMPVYLMIPHSLFAVMAAVAVALRYQAHTVGGQEDHVLN